MVLLGRALGHSIFSLIGLKKILFTNIFQKLQKPHLVASFSSSTEVMGSWLLDRADKQMKASGSRPQILESFTVQGLFRVQGLGFRG